MYCWNNYWLRKYGSATNDSMHHWAHKLDTVIMQKKPLERRKVVIKCNLRVNKLRSENEAAIDRLLPYDGVNAVD